MHYAWVVAVPLSLCLSGCGLVLDLDPDDPQPPAGADAGPPEDSGEGSLDAGDPRDAGDDGDGSTPDLDAGRADASPPPRCGDGRLDPESEQCDDGNDADGDGCDRDCTWSCESNLECQDGDVCNGAETCDPATHTCKRGTPMTCATPDPCHATTCEPRTGCLSVLMDADGDGHAPRSLGSCGTDCNDADPTTYAGAPERCDAVDHDCDGSESDASSEARCYADVDGDGFGDPLESRLTCYECESGEVARGGDCFDDAADVNPAQTSFFAEPFCDASATDALCFDYDCNGTEELRWPELAARCRLLSLVIGCAAGGWDGAVPGCGEEGTWVSCEPGLGGLTCSASRTTRRQECR